MSGMDQITLGLDRLPKKARKEVFLDEMNQVVPWAALIALIQPHARGAHQTLDGRPPFAVETMLRIHCLQLWWNLSDPAMEEELHERPLYRRFVGLLDRAARLPDESTILRFRHLLEKHQLAPQVLLATINAGLAQQGLMPKTGTVADATIIAAASSTKIKDAERDPDMHQTKKGNQLYFGMKAHIGVDAESGRVDSVIGTAANVNDVTQAAGVLHGQETHAWDDTGYQGVDKRKELKNSKACWRVTIRPGKRWTLDPERELHQLLEQVERLKASVRAKVDHPFQVIKQPLGCAKMRYRGLAKNTAQLHTLFGLSNLWMVRTLEAAGMSAPVVRQKGAAGPENGPVGGLNDWKSAAGTHHETPTAQAASAGAADRVLQTFPRKIYLNTVF